MKVPHRPLSRPVHALALAALFTAGAASAQGTFDSSPAVQEVLKQLATQDPQLQKSRWGDLAAAAGKAWLQTTPGDVTSLWRHPRWIVPGAVMRYQRGFCIATKCQSTDYLVQYNAGARQLEFFEDGAMAYVGRIQDDGSVRLVGTGLIGVLTAETLKFDATSNTLSSDKHELKAATPEQLATATRGFAAASAHEASASTAAPAVAAAPAAAASSASEEAQLRAELAQMKAKLDALSRQVEQQAAAAPATPVPAKPVDPAQARAEEQRILRETRQREAQQRRLEAEQQAREEAARRAEAARLAREQAEARAAEARRAAEEKRAREEEARRQAAEDKARALAEQRAREEEARRAAAEEKARAAAAKAAEAQRLAEEKIAAAQAARAAAPGATAAARPAASRNACGGVDGIYGVVASNYRIEVKFEGDTLTVREPNRTSPYRHEGNCQYAFTHPNGTTYRMAVKPRALSAYKQDPASATELALIQAHAAPQASGQCKLEPIPVQNPQALHPGRTELFGVHAIPGVTLDGEYNAPEPNGRPRTVLGPNGVGGTFEVYGAPKREYVYGIQHWYIQANCDGTLVKESYPVADRYYLIFKLDRPYTGLEWHRMQFIVRKDSDRVSIDDRVRK